VPMIDTTNRGLWDRRTAQMSGSSQSGDPIIRHVFELPQSLTSYTEHCAATPHHTMLLLHMTGSCRQCSSAHLTCHTGHASVKGAHSGDLVQDLADIWVVG
jgi:hypothetical protein